VASTNFLKAALVTSVRSMKKAARSTLCRGCSSPTPSFPIVYEPAATITIPSGGAGAAGFAGGGVSVRGGGSTATGGAVGVAREPRAKSSHHAAKIELAITITATITEAIIT